MMNSLKANGAKGNGKTRQRDKITNRHVLYFLGYFSGICVAPTPRAQNKQAKVDPMLKIDKVVTEYLKFMMSVSFLRYT